MSKRKPLKDYIVAVDFDGTLFSSDYPEAGVPVAALASLTEYLYGEGYLIQIWTCRTGRPLETAREALDRHGIPYDLINENPRNRIDLYGTDTRKSCADIFIDDKNAGGIPDPILILSHIIRAGQHL